MAEESRRTWSLVIGVLIAFIVLAGLAYALLYVPRGPADSPAGPAETSISPAPESTGGANATGTEGGAHAGGVSATTFNEVVAAIEASGIEIGSTSSLRMTTADNRRMTVEGGGMSRDGRTIQVVRMERTDGEWRVADAR